MTAPRRLQLRRGNSTAVSTYTGAAGEVVIDTTNWILYVHDGSTVGGYATTTNVAGITGNITQANLGLKGYVDLANTIQLAQISSANVGIKGYIDLANTIQSAQISSANVGIKGYIDQANTIQSGQLASANLGIIGYIDLANTIQSSAIIDANLGMKGYVDSVATLSSYSNVNVKAYTETMGFQNFSNVNVAAYVTTANSAIIGYIDLANTIQSAQVGAANLAITAANVGMQGYVDLANTIQSAQVGAANLAITAANVGMQGYVDLANTIQSAQVGAANLAIIAANLGMKGYVDSVASQSIYGNSNVKSYLTDGFDGNIIPSANVTYSLGSPTSQWRDLFVSNTTIYLGGIPLSIDASGTLLVNGNVVQGAGGTTYSNVNVAAYLTTEGYAKTTDITSANLGLKGYVDQANTIQSGQLASANLGIIGYVDQANTIQSAQITAANVGLKGYVDNAVSTANVGIIGYIDLANTIQSAANVGMKGYVDSQSFYSNVQVATFLPTYTGNISADNITGNTAGFAIGYRDIPQVSFTANATIAAADAGKHFYSTVSTNYVLTIANNSAVSWPVGTAVTVVNRGTGNITVAQAAGVSLYLAGNSSAGNRTVTTYGMVTLLNVAANVWMINGAGVS